MKKSSAQRLREALIRAGFSDGHYQASDVAKAIENLIDEKIAKSLETRVPAPPGILRERK